MTRFRDMRDSQPVPGEAKVICTLCGATMAHADRPGTGTCRWCLARQAMTGQQPVPGTRALRRRLFGQRRSHAGRLSPSDKRKAAAMGVEVPDTMVVRKGRAVTE